MKILDLKWLSAIVSTIILATGLFLFVNAKEKPTGKENLSVTFQHWDLTGANPENADEYEPASPTTTCGGEQYICQIYAPADLVADPSGNTPDLGASVNANETVIDKIRDALNTGTPNETATLKDTP